MKTSTAILILTLLTLLAYANSFSVPFVFDDAATIQANPAVRSGTFDWNLRRSRSILYLTFTLNSRWSGQDVWSYHLVNVLLHLANGLLLFTIAERLLNHRTYALMAASLFLVHPVQTESVTYISSRSELLSAFFYLIAILIFIAWPRERIGLACAVIVAIPFLLGLQSKETVITLPAAFLLVDLCFWSGARARWRFYLTYAIGGLVAVYVLTSRLIQQGVVLEGEISPGAYLLTQFRVIARYIRLVFLPTGLNLDHDVRLSASFWEPAVFASFLFLGGILILGWCLRYRAPVVTFSIFWFFLTLAPTSSVIPIQDVMFEHRLYLPLAGACLCVPGVMAAAYGKVRGVA